MRVTAAIALQRHIIGLQTPENFNLDTLQAMVPVARCALSTYGVKIADAQAQQIAHAALFVLPPKKVLASTAAQAAQSWQDMCASHISCDSARPHAHDTSLKGASISPQTPQIGRKRQRNLA